MKVLLTGGAGFIGSHTCLALLAKYYWIVVIDSFVNSNKLSFKCVINTFHSNKTINNICYLLLYSELISYYKIWVKIF